VSLPVIGQDKHKLKKQQNLIAKKIKQTEELLKLAEQDQANKLTELAMINHQIANRDELIQNFDYQIRKVDDQIQALEVQIVQSENNLKILKEEYIKMLQFAYKNRNTEFELFYIFSAVSFHESFQRMQYIDQYKNFRIQQVEKIQNSQDELKSKMDTLQAVKLNKSELLASQAAQKSNYLKDQKKQQEAIETLAANSESLKAQLISQQKKKKEVSKKLQAAIEAELAAQAKKGKAAFSTAPAAVALSKNFVSNKGKLSWPVDKGAITGKFGKHAHPDYPGVQIENKGVDISTSKGAKVKCIFGGEVTTVFSIPGAGKAVIITHGNYKTVYSNLQEVYVKKGDNVKTKDKIGKLLPADVGTLSVSHIEIHKISQNGTLTAMNPELWFRK